MSQVDVMHELTTYLSDQRVKPRPARQLVYQLGEIMRRELSQGNAVTLPGVGVIRVWRRRERTSIASTFSIRWCEAVRPRPAI